LVVGRSRWPVASRAPDRLGADFGTPAGAVARKPMAAGISGQSEITTNVAEGKTLGTQSKGLLANVGRMHALIFEQGYDIFVSPVGFEPTLYGF
jgi:hypothetical protein